MASSGIFQTSRSRGGKVGRSWPWSRLRLKIRSLSLGLQGLVYMSMFNAILNNLQRHNVIE